MVRDMGGNLAQGVHLIFRLELGAEALVDFVHDIGESGKFLLGGCARVALDTGKALVRRGPAGSAGGGEPAGGTAHRGQIPGGAGHSQLVGPAAGGVRRIIPPFLRHTDARGPKYGLSRKGEDAS